MCPSPWPCLPWLAVLSSWVCSPATMETPPATPSSLSLSFSLPSCPSVCLWSPPLCWPWVPVRWHARRPLSPGACSRTCVCACARVCRTCVGDATAHVSARAQSQSKLRLRLPELCCQRCVHCALLSLAIYLAHSCQYGVHHTLLGLNNASLCLLWLLRWSVHFTLLGLNNASLFL